MNPPRCPRCGLTLQRGVAPRKAVEGGEPGPYRLGGLDTLITCLKCRRCEYAATMVLLTHGRKTA